MKILYGVQATGNGHISRARAMAPVLAAAGVDVTYLFSGRSRDKLFDMERFGDYLLRDGLTFVAERGRVRPFATLRQNHVPQLLSDIRSLELDPFDVIISDFEPITSWAARRQKRQTIGISHQCAFCYDVPVAGRTLHGELVLKHFAPTDIHLGLHWHHFGQPLLPPLVEPPEFDYEVDPGKILVYLPFEGLGEIETWLAQASGAYRYVVYHGEVRQPHAQGKISLRPFSRSGFQRDLAECSGVVANAGFELAAEALHLGKKLLVKPLAGQMEQASNALALTQIGCGTSMESLSGEALSQWLEGPGGRALAYPDVARAITDWLMAGHYQDHTGLVEDLWQGVGVSESELEAA